MNFMQSRFLSTIMIVAALLAGADGATTFNPGNLVLLQVNGTTSDSSSVTLREVSFNLDYATPSNSSAVQVQRIDLTATGGNRLTASGSAILEGKLTLSADGRYLALAGYDSDVGVASIAGTTSSTVNRVAVTVGSDGQIATRVSFGNTAFNGSSVRGAYAVDGAGIYGVGNGSAAGSSGIWYATSTESSQIASGNYRGLATLDGNNLVALTGANTISGNPRVQLLTGFPTSAATPVAFGAGLPDTGEVNMIVAFSLGGVVIDTVYLAQQSAIEKFSLVGETWTSNGSLATGTNGAGDLTAYYDEAHERVNLFTVGAGSLQWLSDDVSAFNTAFTGSFTTMIHADANSNLRGVAFAPIPEPSTAFYVGFGMLGLLCRRRCK